MICKAREAAYAKKIVAKTGSYIARTWLTSGSSSWKDVTFTRFTAKLCVKVSCLTLGWSNSVRFELRLS